MLTSNQTVIVDVDNNQTAGAPGAAAVAGMLQVGGNDGTNLRAILTDASGRQVAVGAAATGAAPAGAPVYTGGFDGTNVQPLRLDTTGRQIVVGAAADGAAVAGNPVLTAGSDGTNAQTVLVDTSGRFQIVGAAAVGAAPSGNPLLIAGYDGTNVQTILTDSTGKLVTTTSPTAAGTSALSNVASSTSSVTLLAANSARLGATIVNDGNRNLYAKFGTTASTTSFTVKIPANGYYEVPFAYTGRIEGIWDVANGSARMTELTA